MSHTCIFAVEEKEWVWHYEGERFELGGVVGQQDLRLMTLSYCVTIDGKRSEVLWARWRWVEGRYGFNGVVSCSIWLILF